MVQSFLWPQEGASTKETRTVVRKLASTWPHTGMGTDVMHTTRTHTRAHAYIRS